MRSAPVTATERSPLASLPIASVIAASGRTTISITIAPSSASASTRPIPAVVMRPLTVLACRSAASFLAAASLAALFCTRPSTKLAELLARGAKVAEGERDGPLDVTLEREIVASLADAFIALEGLLDLLESGAPLRLVGEPYQRVRILQGLVDALAKALGEAALLLGVGLQEQIFLGDRCVVERHRDLECYRPTRGEDIDDLMRAGRQFVDALLGVPDDAEGHGDQNGRRNDQ